jgi:hypothetical protein
MKSIILIIFCAFTFAQNINAQTTIEKTDTAKALNGHLKIISKQKDGSKKTSAITLGTKRDSIRKVFETSWGGIDLGFNNYKDETDYANLKSLSSDGQTFFSQMKTAPVKNDFELRSGKSIHVNINIVKAQLSLYKNYISLVSGITYDINNWSYKNSITWNSKGGPNPNKLSTDYITMDSIVFRKNKLVTNYLQVPLLLRFETSPRHEKKNVYISVGAYAGYLVRVHTKQIEKGSNEKLKDHADFNITKFQYGTQFEIGYQGFSIYFKNSLTPLTEYGPTQNPYCFGIRLSEL